MPIRWRLALGYASMLALVVLVAGVALLSSPWWREREADTSMTQQQVGREIAILAIRDGGSLKLTASTYLTIEGVPYVELTGKMVPVAPMALEAPIEPSLGMGSPNSMVVFQGRDGRVSFQSFSGVSLSIHDAPLAPALMPLAAPSRSGTLDLLDDEPPMQPGLVDGTGSGLRDLIPMVAITIPVLLLVIAAGYVLSGRALRPVTRMTSLVSTIGAEDLHSRLNLDLPDDEIGQLAQTLDGMLERVQRGYDNQAQFAGNAAHELRTPLTSMRTLIDLTLTRARTTDEYRDVITQLDVDLGRLTSLVETLLALARAENGQLRLDVSRFDLAQTIENVVEMFRQQDAVTSVDLQMVTDPVEVSGDEDLIIQVLVNLIDNACRHTMAGGSVTVSCERDHDWAVVRVVDTGEGIAPEHVERVFERFYRAGSDHRGGAGLGLAITRAIVERHGGTIRLQSEQGAGTEVEFQLPVGDAVA